MPDFTPAQWALICIGAFGNGFLKRVFGAGVGITLMPILAISFPAKFSLVFLALCTTWVDIGISRSMWDHWDRRTTFLFLPGMTAGIVFGGWVLSWVPEYELRLFIGGLCGLIAGYQIFVEIKGRPPEIPPIPVWGALALVPSVE